MKFTFSILSIVAVFAVCKAQQPAGYYVSYTYVQETIDYELADSLDAFYGKESQMQARVLGDSNYHAPLQEVLARFSKSSFRAPVFIIAYDDSSKMFFQHGNKSKTLNHVDADDNTGISITINTPDTQYYKNGQWVTLRSGNTDTLQSIILDFSKDPQRATKDILGYRCQKFMHLGSAGQPEIIIWACQDLPATLIPYVGLQSFKYGILEIQHLAEGWYTEATGIRQLQ